MDLHEIEAGSSPNLRTSAKVRRREVRCSPTQGLARGRLRDPVTSRRLFLAYKARPGLCTGSIMRVAACQSVDRYCWEDLNVYAGGTTMPDARERKSRCLERLGTICCRGRSYLPCLHILAMTVRPGMQSYPSARLDTSH